MHDNHLHTYMFQSTPSLRRATHGSPGGVRVLEVSIHALLAESYSCQLHHPAHSFCFNPRPPCGERPVANALHGHFQMFQSTPSLRRATGDANAMQTADAVSIHALLAESDRDRRILLMVGGLFQSTPSLRRATADHHNFLPQKRVSIHALLAESDSLPRIALPRSDCFNPRPPCGERHGHPCGHFSQMSFNPRPPCGERQALSLGKIALGGFQSTPSLRRATVI